MWIFFSHIATIWYFCRNLKYVCNWHSNYHLHIQQISLNENCLQLFNILWDTVNVDVNTQKLTVYLKKYFLDIRTWTEYSVPHQMKHSWNPHKKLDFFTNALMSNFTGNDVPAKINFFHFSYKKFSLLNSFIKNR